MKEENPYSLTQKVEHQIPARVLNLLRVSQHDFKRPGYSGVGAIKGFFVTEQQKIITVNGKQCVFIHSNFGLSPGQYYIRHKTVLRPRLQGFIPRFFDNLPKGYNLFCKLTTLDIGSLISVCKCMGFVPDLREAAAMLDVLYTDFSDCKTTVFGERDSKVICVEIKNNAGIHMLITILPYVPVEGFIINQI